MVMGARPRRRTKQDEVRDHIEAIVEGLPVGAALPPERDLAVRFEVSRMTVRHALDVLVRRGLLQRRQGAGTFVTDAKVDQLLGATSFSEDVIARGMVPGATCLHVRAVPAGSELAHRMGLMEGRELLDILRVRTIDAEPVALEQAFLVASDVPGLSAEDLEDGSLYALLADRYGRRIARGEQTLEAVVLDATQSRALGVRRGAPAFHLERTSWDHDERVVEHVRSTYRGDRFRFTTPLGRLSPSAERAR